MDDNVSIQYYFRLLLLHVCLFCGVTPNSAPLIFFPVQKVSGLFRRSLRLPVLRLPDHIMQCHNRNTKPSVSPVHLPAQDVQHWSVNQHSAICKAVQSGKQKSNVPISGISWQSPVSGISKEEANISALCSTGSLLPLQGLHLCGVGLLSIYKW